MNFLLRWNRDVKLNDLPGISQILSVTEIVIHLDSLLTIIDSATRFLSQPSFAALPATDALYERKVSILEKFRCFPPADDRFIDCKWSYPLGKLDQEGRAMQPSRCHIYGPDIILTFQIGWLLLRICTITICASAPSSLTSLNGI